MTRRDVTLSVVVPAHDEAPNLERLLREVHAALDPGGLAWELIVVDDGSTDDTGAVLDRLALADDRLRVVRLPRALRPDRGAARWLPGGCRLAHRDARRRPAVSAGRAAGTARGARRRRPRLRHPYRAQRPARTPDRLRHLERRPPLLPGATPARPRVPAPGVPRRRPRARRSRHAALRGGAPLAPRAVHPGRPSGRRSARSSTRRAPRGYPSTAPPAGQGRSPGTSATCCVSRGRARASCDGRWRWVGSR